MKLHKLKNRERPIVKTILHGEELFISQYGLFNCEILKLKDANTVVKIMSEYDKESILDINQKKFILDNSNKKVLCNVKFETDIFIYGEDNIAFQLECFE